MHRGQKPKELDNLSDIPEVMICGIINHGIGVIELYAITEPHTHDSSLTISILHSHLTRHLASRNYRPTSLHLQLDNSGKDNKNRYMIGYCGVGSILTLANVCQLLLKLQWFKNIQLHFLMKGHTHCDIDQLFSTYSRAAYKKDWSSPEQLFAFIRSSYKTIKVELITKVDKHDWSGFIESHIVQLKGHQAATHFSFILNADNQECFLYSGKFF